MPKPNGWVFERLDTVICLHDVLHSFGDEVVEGLNVLLHETSDLWVQSTGHTQVSKKTNQHELGINQMTHVSNQTN